MERKLSFFYCIQFIFTPQSIDINKIYMLGDCEEKKLNSLRATSYQRKELASK